MKRFLWIVCLALWLYPAAAQAQDYATDKGSFLIGGAASLSSSGNDFEGGRSTTLSIAPSAQYFVIPGLAVGGTIGWAYASYEDFSFSTLNVGPRLSYYFGRSAQNIYPFVSAAVGYLRSSSDSGAFDQTASGTQFDVSGGATFMIARNVGLTGELFYTQRSEETDTDVGLLGDITTAFGSDSFGLRFGISAFVF